MKKLLDAMQTSIIHLSALDETFQNATTLTNPEATRYNKVLKDFNDLLDKNIPIHNELYNEKGRQMILADVLEYAFLSRGANLLSLNENKGNFIKIILVFVNLLMSYEDMTSEVKLRNAFLNILVKKLPQIKSEEGFSKLSAAKSYVGISSISTDKKVNKYFDKLLPKTAGGLWHELLVYIFMLRNDAGYIVPLLLHQRLIGLDSHLVPPDFLIIKDKRIYGIEVGASKDLQSSTFAIKTGIPIASVDTINSRTTDRCPICKKWIHFCDEVIDKYSNLDFELPGKVEIKCLSGCTKYTKEQISTGKCSESKYSRPKTKNINHKFTNSYHYHYACVLNALNATERKKLIAAEDKTAIKTHYPYYSGIDELFKN